MNLMEHEVMSAPIGAEAAGEQKQTVEKARTKIIDAAPLMERLRAAIAFGNEKGMPTDELEQVLEDIEGMEELPPAQPEKPTEKRTETHACDSISRQAAIEKILGQPPEPHYPSWYAEQIKELPPAEPERIKGHWIDAVIPNDSGGLPVIVCDKCNTFFPLQFGDSHNFCPNCGADMRGEQDG